MSSTRQRLSPEDRRSQLIELAMQVFAKDGLERAGHGDIAKLAGVSTATVFNYFPTREDLVEAVLDRIRDQVRGMFKLMGDGTVGVGMMVKGFDYLIETQPDLVKTFLRWSVAFGDTNRAAFLAFQEELLNAISARLKQPQKDRSEARIILGAADMYALMKLDNTPEDVIARFVERLLSVLGE